MRYYEFTENAIKPLSPSTARINALKQTKEKADNALTAEKARQKQAKASERVQKAQQALVKARMI